MKRMKVWHVLLISSILILIGYIVGQYMPIDYLRPIVVNRELSINDYYTRIISIVGTFVTFLAIAVALFKEDIRKFWDKASLGISFKEDLSVHEVLDNETVGSSDYRANKYESVLVVSNYGSLAAKNCEIYLEGLQFSGQNFPSPQNIPLKGNPLKWNSNSNSSILIPMTGKAYVSIVEVLSSDSQVVNAGDIGAASSQPKIRIGDTESPSDFSHGVWKARFKIYSENANPIEHKIQITWNGRWENRITEMNRFLQIQVIK